jgi:glycosyltransferase involved in cell wall biosynthesis
MATPKVSVIIPTYNGVNYLGEAIRSVLGQTYPNFELLIVNDASPDNTSEVIESFNDPRIKYLIHEQNQGVDQARYTGLNNSSGEIIAFLDQDDFFHPDKLQAHVTFLENHPDVGFTYNSRYELNHSDKTIRNLWRPPREITLADLVVWFPIAPSDWVLRRNWAFRLHFGDYFFRTGGEIVYLGYLYLDGCKFGYVDRALNYRWHHSGRIFRDLIGSCASEIKCQVMIFNDPRCPSEVLALQDIAHANIFMFWAYRAFIQEETEIGQKFLRKAVQHKSSILIGKPCELVRHIVMNCSEDENLKFSELLEKIFAQLPPEMNEISDQFEWALARGYLLKGTRAIIWDRPEDARGYFRHAEMLNAEVDEFFLSHLTQKMLDYEAEFGETPTRKLFKTILRHIEKLGDSESSQQLSGMFTMNRVFQSYRNGDYNLVPGQVITALASDPRNLSNRGLFAMLLRSIFNMLAKMVKVNFRREIL